MKGILRALPFLSKQSGFFSHVSITARSSARATLHRVPLDTLLYAEPRDPDSCAGVLGASRPGGVSTHDESFTAGGSGVRVSRPRNAGPKEEEGRRNPDASDPQGAPQCRYRGYPQADLLCYPPFRQGSAFAADSGRPQSTRPDRKSTRLN